MAAASVILILSADVWAAAVECPKVMSALSRGARMSSGSGVDISEVAKKLGTSIAWVEHCMRIYGRRPRRPGLESAEGREGRLEAMEDFEPEEPVESEDRGELELPRTRAKQPQIRVKKPTPIGGFGGD